MNQPHCFSLLTQFQYKQGRLGSHGLLPAHWYSGDRSSALKLAHKECNAMPNLLSIIALIILISDIPIGPLLNTEMAFISQPRSLLKNQLRVHPSLSQIHSSSIYITLPTPLFIYILLHSHSVSLRS